VTFVRCRTVANVLSKLSCQVDLVKRPPGGR
jgi:hypothetical protein